MEEKNFKKRGSIWAFFSNWFFNKLFFLTANNRTFLHNNLAEYKFFKSSGFTLIELLVTIALVGVLTASFIIIINPAKQLSRARDGHRKSDLQQIRSALELYRADCGSYPAEDPSSANHLPISLTSTCTDSTITYLQTVPVDPKSAGRYWYNIDGYSGGYALVACLENNYLDDDDPDTVPNAGCTSPSWGVYSYNLRNP